MVAYALESSSHWNSDLKNSQPHHWEHRQNQLSVSQHQKLESRWLCPLFQAAPLSFLLRLTLLPSLKLQQQHSLALSILLVVFSLLVQTFGLHPWPDFCRPSEWRSCCCCRSKSQHLQRIHRRHSQALLSIAHAPLLTQARARESFHHWKSKQVDAHAHLKAVQD